MAKTVNEGLGFHADTEYLGRVWQMGDLIFQYKEVDIQNTAGAQNMTTVTFPKAFPSDCIVTIPICIQGGFGAESTISVIPVDNSSCKVAQKNNINSASMQIGLFSIGC